MVVGLAQALLPITVTAAPAFILETSAPEGFAELTEPQWVVVDLYFGSRFLGAAQVVVTPESVQFQEPEAVLALLPDVLDRKLVLQGLSTRLARNSHRICYSKHQSDCGYLEPEQVAVIYDDSKYRLDLFFAPSLLPQQQAIRDPYLPDSSSDFSLVQNLTGTWSGVDAGHGRSTQSFSLLGNTIASNGEGGLHAQWWATDTQGAGLQSLHWTRDYRGKAYSVGLFQPANSLSYFSTNQSIYGIEYRSSDLTRQDISQQQGAPIEVNMPVRGRVEIYRNNQLIHSELLEAGNQLLNTSTLPAGSYDVEVRTFDEAGRSINRFNTLFTKDSLLPPPGEWRWSLIAGKPAIIGTGENIPDYFDDNLVQASLGRRLTDNTGIFTTAATSGSQQLLELGARWVGNAFEISPSVVETSDGRGGYRLQALLRTHLFTASASELRLDAPESAVSPGGYNLLPSGYFQRNASIHSNLFGGQTSLRYTQRDQPQVIDSGAFNLDTEFVGARTLVTLEYRKNFLQSALWQGDMVLSHSDADGEQYTAFGFQFRHRTPRWQNTASVRSEYSDTEGSDIRAGLRSQWNDGEIWAAKLEQELAAETTGDEHFLESRTHLAGRMGYIHSTVNYVDSPDSRAMNYAGAFSTNLISTGDTFAWGGDQALESAVSVNIDGSKDRQFEILVDGRRQGYANGGDRSVINLPAFDSYDISLRPLDSNLYDYRETRESVTLYPGNVTSTSYNIRPLVLVFGRLLSKGSPLPQTRISIGEYSAVTDEYGVFQMEMYVDPGSMRAPDVVWGDCRVPLPRQDSGEDWLNLGAIDLASAKCPGKSYAMKAHADQ